MVKEKSPKTIPAYEPPRSSLWCTPLTWSGEDATPIDNYRDIPANAVFTRAELIVYSTEQAFPALMRLHEGKPIEVYVKGFDGAPWTFRKESRGRAFVWRLYVGDSFPGTHLAPPELRKQFESELEYITVQTILPLAGSGKAISFMIRDDGSVEDFAKVSQAEVEDD
ncbi:MAG TPA: hypothetical protein PLJ47_13430 [Candidatus Hydrogenedentes bacterium]|nr:hypothetical protein [Candidatus Hydrogenedentota bacterium]HRK35593.1 hypothetical protein [Candidatus Hydrogenedentota bacterium]